MSTTSNVALFAYNKQQNEVKFTAEDEMNWQHCLNTIDKKISEISARCNQSKFIIISLPHKLDDIHDAIECAVNASLSTDCFDVIIDYLIPNKQCIANQILSPFSKSETAWNINKHCQLLDKEAVIIIDIENGEYQTVPRCISDISQSDDIWKLEWQRNVDSLSLTEIFSVISHEIIINHNFAAHFDLFNDWSFKIQFDLCHNSQIGYLCDDDQIVRGAVIRKHSENQSIFVHYGQTAGSRGLKFEWISLPNQRLCGPDIPETHYHLISKNVNETNQINMKDLIDDDDDEDKQDDMERDEDDEQENEDEHEIEDDELNVSDLSYIDWDHEDHHLQQVIIDSWQ